MCVVRNVCFGSAIYKSSSSSTQSAGFCGAASAVTNWAMLESLAVRETVTNTRHDPRTTYA
jgi:hypothetical protein